MLPCNGSALTQLFSSIWAAFDNKTLSTSLERERRENITAFITSVSECAAVYTRKLVSGPPECTLDLAERKALALSFVGREWSRLWSETLEGHFRLSSQVLGSLLGKGLVRLYNVDAGMVYLSLFLIGITT